MFRVFAGRELIHSGDFVIFKEDGIRCNYSFCVCNQGKGINDFCVTQLISVPGKPLQMYRKRRRIEDRARVDELLEEWDNDDEAVNRSVKLLEKLTGNEFDLWERAKQFKKKMHKFMSIDIV